MKLTGERILVFIILMIVILSLILPKNYFWKPAKGIFITLCAPIQKVVSGGSSSVYNFLTTIGNISELSQENKSYKQLCKMLAQLQLDLIKVSKTTLKKDIENKTQEIFKSSSTYEELCWLIAELKAIKKKHSFTS